MTMFQRDLSKMKVSQVEGIAGLKWAEELVFSLPTELAEQLILHSGSQDGQVLNISKKNINDKVISLSRNAETELKYRSAYTNRSPISSRLPINYQWVPSFVRDGVAKMIGRIKRYQVNKNVSYPSWPIDLSADFASDIFNLSSPGKFTDITPVLLTHDLDTSQGLENLIRHFLDLEEDVGARSCNYIVPCSWSINNTLLEQVVTRGHEIGIHGFDHSNKTPFMTSSDRLARLRAPNLLINKYHVKGYRAPSLLRTQGLLEDLASLYQYDSSIPTSGGPFPVPDNGCASARPFKIGNIWEIPISMPRDGSMIFLGYTPNQILEKWIYCADLVSRSGGVVNLLTHCEARFSGNSRMLSIYQKFLNYLKGNKKFVFMLPNELVSQMEATLNG